MLLARSWANGGQCSFVPQPCYDPATMLLVSAGATAAGAGIKAAGTIAGGKQAQQGADYQANQMRGQATLTRQKANATRVQAQYLRERAGQIRQQAEGMAEGERAAGKQELAEAQVTASEYKRQKDLAASALQARAGAGGLMATDPTALALADDIAKRGTLQERRAVFSGTNARAGRYGKARAISQEGAIAGRNTDVQAHMTDVEGALQDWEAGNLDQQALWTNWEGAAKKKASWLEAAGTILGGVSTIAGKYGPPGGTTTQSKSSKSPYRFGQP
jgi:hypothetical protein